MSPAVKTTRGTAWIIDATGATYRQLDSWVRHGHFGDGAVVGQGSGSRRLWTAADAEVAWVLARCSELGNTALGTTRVTPFFEIASDAVRASRVDPMGEWLVLTADGRALRSLHWCICEDFTGVDAARVIRLRAFTDEDAA